MVIDLRLPHSSSLNTFIRFILPMSHSLGEHFMIANYEAKDCNALLKAKRDQIPENFGTMA